MVKGEGGHDNHKGNRTKEFFSHHKEAGYLHAVFSGAASLYTVFLELLGMGPDREVR